MSFIAALRPAPALLLPPALAFYVRPSPQGNGNGRSWNDAGSLGDIPRFLDALLPGGKIYVAADDGTYHVTTPAIVDRKPWQGRATITSVNMDGSAGTAQIDGNRVTYIDGVDFPRSDPAHDGYDVFRIADGATDLVIDNFIFNNAGMGVCFLGNATRPRIANLAVSNCLIAINAERDVAAHTIAANTYTIAGLVVQNVTVAGCELGGFLSAAHHTFDPAVEPAIAISGITQANPAVLTVIAHGWKRGHRVSVAAVAGMTQINGLASRIIVVDADHVALQDPVTGATVDSTGFSSYAGGGIAQRQAALLVEDMTVDAQRQRGQAFCDCFHMSGTSVGAVVNRFEGRNAAYYLTGGIYWNSDGIGDEGLTDQATYTDCKASGNDDGGFDLKGTNVVLNRPIVSTSKKNIKVWANGEINDAQSTNPVKNGGTDVADHYLFAGSGNTTWTLNRPVIRGTSGNAAPVFRNEKSSGVLTLNVNNYDIIIQPAAPLLSDSPGNAVVTYNPALPSITAIVPAWRTGHEAGVIDEATATATVIADLSIAGTASSPTFSITADADGFFALSGSQLALNATLNPAIKTSHTCTIQATDGTGIAKKTANITIYVNATTLDTDTQNWYNALVAASLTTPQRRWRSAYDNWIREMKRANSGAHWGVADGVMSAISYDSAVAKRNVRRDAYHATWNGSPTWSAKNPWTGNGTDAKISIPFNASTAGGNFQQNSCHMLVSKAGTNVDENAADFSVDGTTRSSLRARNGNLYYACLQGTSLSSTANTTSIRRMGVNRIVSTQYKRFLDSSTSTITATSTALFNANLVLGHNSVSGGWTVGSYEGWSWGGGMPNEISDANAFWTAFAQFKAQAAIAE